MILAPVQASGNPAPLLLVLRVVGVEIRLVQFRLFLDNRNHRRPLFHASLFLFGHGCVPLLRNVTAGRIGRTLGNHAQGFNARRLFFGFGSRLQLRDLVGLRLVVLSELRVRLGNVSRPQLVSFR